MTMNNVIAKLRKKNIANYYMLMFCIVLSVILVTSYALMYLSPTVQNVLPMGGDSRKQATLIFAVAIVGCSVFTTYASSLFFKYKSREFGVFMALGEKKSALKKVLLQELSFIIAVCSFAGLVLSIPISFGIWKIFQFFIVDTKEMAYQMSITGFLYGIAFCIFVSICIFLTGVRFVKRSNIIEIIQEQRKSEIPKDVKPWCGTVGWILVVFGILLGYFGTPLALQLFNILLPAAWNLVFLLSLVGIYMVMLHTITCSRKGRNPKKYYKNLISVNMMRFSGRQTVKSMCVIAFLVAAALFASFYVPSNAAMNLTLIAENPVDYTFFYAATENQIERNEIFALAKEHDVSILDYCEVTSSLLITNKIQRDYDENQKLITEYDAQKIYGNFFSQSEFNRISGQSLSVENGHYYTIMEDVKDTGFWNKPNDLDLITSPISGISEKMQFSGVAAFYPLSNNKNVTRFILSDEDFNRLSAGLTTANQEIFILFNVENPMETYSFANALKNEIIKRSSPKSAVLTSYDEYESELARKNGERYWQGEYKFELSPDNTQLFSDWKYYPSFVVLGKQDMIKNMAVFLMLFIYIAIICFAAVSVIAYTRCITVGLDNKTMFGDLAKLGSNKSYRERILKKQLAKICVFPAVVGSVATFLFDVVIKYGNSSSISSGEMNAIYINFAVSAAAILLMYGVYRLSLSKVKTIVAI